MSTKERFKLIPAVYLLLRRDNEVLLLRRAGTGYQDGKYSLVAGHLDGDELATEAMVREAMEEVCVKVDISDLRFVHIVHRLCRGQIGQERLDIFFEATKWQGDIAIGEPDKCDDLSWCPMDDLPEDIIPFVKHVLTDIANGVGYSEYAEEPL
ncbi:MAG TPA: NUDIX domain-containing protein [Candidatus Saccharimonadales bacterium]